MESRASACGPETATARRTPTFHTASHRRRVRLRRAALRDARVDHAARTVVDDLHSIHQPLRSLGHWRPAPPAAKPDLRQLRRADPACPPPPAHWPSPAGPPQRDDVRPEDLHALRDDLHQLRADLRDHRSVLQHLRDRLPDGPLDRRAAAAASRSPAYYAYGAAAGFFCTLFGFIGYLVGFFLGSANREEARLPAAAGDGAECGRAGPTPAVGVPGTPSSRPPASSRFPDALGIVGAIRGTIGSLNRSIGKHYATSFTAGLAPPQTGHPVRHLRGLPRGRAGAPALPPRPRSVLSIDASTVGCTDACIDALFDIHCPDASPRAAGGGAVFRHTSR